MLRHITFTVFITTSMNILATGMVPETSVLLVDEKRGEASINIKNTDDHPSLLYTTIVDLPESNKSIRLIPTQPVIRVEAGQVQQVRFLGNDSNLLIVFYVQIMPDDFVMQLHRF